MSTFYIILGLRVKELFPKHTSFIQRITESAVRACMFIAGFIVVLTAARYLAFRGLSPILPVLSYVLSLFAGFLITVLHINEMLTGQDDREFLLSLPVSETVHAAVLFLRLYIKSLIPTILLCCPAICVYTRYSIMDAAAWLRWIIGLFLTGLPFGSLAAIGGVFITLCLAESPRRNRVQSILSAFILSVGAVLLLFLADRIVLTINSNPELSPADLSAAVLNTIIRNFSFGRFYQYAIVDGDGLYLALFIGMSVLWYIAIGMIITFGYRTAIISIGCPVLFKGFRWGLQKTHSLRYALFIKEIQQFISSRIYLSKAVIGFLLAVLIPFNLLFVPVSSFLSAFHLEQYYLKISFSVPFLICFFTALSSTTYCAFSIEGRYSWIIAASPLSATDLVAGKILLNSIITIPLSLLSGLLFGLALQPSLFWRFLYIIVPVIYSLLNEFWGLFVDKKCGTTVVNSEEAVLNHGLSYIGGYLPGLIIPVSIIVLIFITG